MIMTAVVNVTEDWGIGLNGKLLVTIPEDMKHFRELTTGKTVILGQLTLATFPGGKPLKNRRNISLSDDLSFSPEGAEVVRSIDELDELLKDEPGEAVVIGGASVYNALCERCSKVYSTRTYGEYEADRFFPNLDAAPNWHMGDVSELFEHDGVKFRYITYCNSLKL